MYRGSRDVYYSIWNNGGLSLTLTVTDILTRVTVRLLFASSHTLKDLNVYVIKWVIVIPISKVC